MSMLFLIKPGKQKDKNAMGERVSWEWCTQEKRWYGGCKRNREVIPRYLTVNRFSRQYPVTQILGTP